MTDQDKAPEEPEETVDCEVIPREDICTWTDDVDEKRRAFIISTMAVAEIDGHVLVTNMEMVFQWLKSGALPEEKKTTRAFKAIGKEA